MIKQNRYFVDERIGCVAVRDRVKTDTDYQGLHHDSEGVVKFWNGKQDENGTWYVYANDIESAKTLCAEMNSNRLTNVK